MTEHVHKGAATTANLGSAPEFEALYGDYHLFVRRALKKHYVSADDLEDVTQEVFMVLLARMDEATQKQSLGGWLYQIVRRVAANHHRGDRRRTRKLVALKSAGKSPSAQLESLDPESRVAREEAWTLIRGFLESLDEEACAVFVMSEIEGLKGADIAARLGITLPMTYARIRSVRARFGQRVTRHRQGLLALLPWPSLATTPSQVLAVGWKAKTVSVAIALALVWLFALGWGGSGAPGSGGIDTIVPGIGVDDRGAGGRRQR